MSSNVDFQQNNGSISTEPIKKPRTRRKPKTQDSSENTEMNLPGRNSFANGATPKAKATASKSKDKDAIPKVKLKANANYKAKGRLETEINSSRTTYYEGDPDIPDAEGRKWGAILNSRAVWISAITIPLSIVAFAFFKNRRN